jgi:hypothetical protein
MQRFDLFGSASRNLLQSGGRWHCETPSFPHAFSGNPGEFQKWPWIKAFGGDKLRENHPRSLDTCSLLWGVIYLAGRAGKGFFGILGQTVCFLECLRV